MKYEHIITKIARRDLGIETAFIAGLLEGGEKP